MVKILGQGKEILVGKVTQNGFQITIKYEGYFPNDLRVNFELSCLFIVGWFSKKEVILT
jgi:hypothetical protein